MIFQGHGFCVTRGRQKQNQTEPYLDTARLGKANGFFISNNMTHIEMLLLKNHC
jgi:hypothetical protein